jgi:GT2 family glycosyltransferase
MVDISVIIPLYKEEIQHHALLASLPQNIEIILTQENGRAPSLNHGAAKAKGKYLWFLHADSKLAHNTIESLLQAIKKHPDNLLYFDLAFINDASPLMFINEWGCWLRSRIFKTPFGDQGLCINKELFKKIGGFPENLKYGEDHIFIWRARQNGIRINSVGAKIYTSARKYKKYGWLRTTLLHQYLWIKQAIPEWKKLIMDR